jgi:hypothetical protein
MLGSACFWQISLDTYETSADYKRDIVTLRPKIKSYKVKHSTKLRIPNTWLSVQYSLSINVGN